MVEAYAFIPPPEKVALTALEKLALQLARKTPNCIHSFGEADCFCLWPILFRSHLPYVILRKTVIAILVRRVRALLL